MTEPGSTFILHVTMAESGSPRRSSEYNLTLSSSLSSEVREEVHLSWPSLEMEMLSSLQARSIPGTIPLCRLYPSAVSPEIEALYVDRVGITDW